MYSKLRQRGILSSLVVTIARVEVAACGEGHTIEHSINYAEHIVFVYRYIGVYCKSTYGYQQILFESRTRA